MVNMSQSAIELEDMLDESVINHSKYDPKKNVYEVPCEHELRYRFSVRIPPSPKHTCHYGSELLYGIYAITNSMTGLLRNHLCMSRE
jgi:hypothetical protein